MGALWMLLMLILRSSPSEEIKFDASEKSLGYGTYHQDTLSYTLVKMTTPHGLTLFTSAGHQSISKDGKKNYTIGIYFTSLTPASSETVNTPPGRMDVKEESLQFPDIESTKDLSVIVKDVPSLSQMLGVVDMEELKECELVLVCDAGYDKQSMVRNLKTLLNPQQVVQINKNEGVRRIVFESSVCRGYLFLFENLKPLLRYTSDYHDSLNYLDSGRTRRSPFSTGPGSDYCEQCTLAHTLAVKSDEDLSLGDLVTDLISLTSGRQFYLVYDTVMPGVESVIRSFQKVFGDTTLLPYDPSIQLLTEVLRSKYHVQALRNVFILCSAAHVANLFKQVNDKVLESPTIQWLVIVDKDMTEELSVLLREGTQVWPGYNSHQQGYDQPSVAMVQMLTSKRAQLFSTRVNLDGQVRFLQVGSWSVSGPWRTKRHQMESDFVPDLQQLYSDFRGRQLVVATKNNWPFFKIKTLRNGTVLPVSGIDYNVINTLSDKLNFTYQLVLPPDGKFGGPQPDNTITGLVGLVARHEAHATLCELTITDLRETVVDFTMPYFLETMTLVSPAPKEKNRSFAILSPFTVEVWLYICLVTALVGPLLFMETRLSVWYMGEDDSVHYSLQSFSFNIYRNLMIQSNLIKSHRWSLRFIFICWYLFCFYIHAMYSGTLTAALAVTAYEEPIDSLYDLAQAHKDGYTIGTIRDTNYDATFKRAKSGIYREVWQLFNHEDRDKSFVPSTDAGFEMILEHKYVLINAELNSRLKATQRGREKFYFARETFLPQGYGIACSSGSPFRDTFSRTSF